VVGADGEAKAMSPEERLSHMGVSPQLSAGYDLLTDDGYPPEKAAELLAEAERMGKDPEAFAQHMIKLRRALRA